MSSRQRTVDSETFRLRMSNFLMLVLHKGSRGCIELRAGCVVPPFTPLTHPPSTWTLAVPCAFSCSVTFCEIMSLLCLYGGEIGSLLQCVLIATMKNSIQYIMQLSYL